MKMLTIGSVTRTIRAQELLHRHGIPAKIRRLDDPVNGCVRALLVEDGQVSRAVRLLADSGIHARTHGDTKP